MSSHSPAFLAQQQRLLIDQRTELSHKLGLSWSPPDREVGDAVDHGNADAEAGMAMAIAERGVDAIREVDAALRRIDDGTYGVCEVTGELIPVERLEVLPFARCSVAAASRRERSTMRQRPVYGIDQSENADQPAPEAEPEPIPAT